jgi:hypothetical protein
MRPAEMTGASRGGKYPKPVDEKEAADFSTHNFLAFTRASVALPVPIPLKHETKEAHDSFVPPHPEG